MAELKKRNGSAIASKIEGGVLTVAVRGFPEIVFDRTRVADCHHLHAEMYGWKQRLCDAGALQRDKATGKSPTDEEKYNEIRRLADHYLSGAEEWAMRGATGPRGPQLDPIILQAVGEAYGRTLDVVRAMVETKAREKGIKPAEYLAKIGEGTTVKPIVERLRAAALASIEIEDDPFAGMDDEGEENGEE
jgi:hypothetical protein